DLIVTGIQTCALPIYKTSNRGEPRQVYAFLTVLLLRSRVTLPGRALSDPLVRNTGYLLSGAKMGLPDRVLPLSEVEINRRTFIRSEERRVGKECRSWM